MQFQETEKLVLEWANERGIIDFDNHRQLYSQVLRTQTLKLTEELGELLGSLWTYRHVNKNPGDTADAIGDMLVVLTSIAWAIPPIAHKDPYTLTDAYKLAMADKVNAKDTELLLTRAVGDLAATIIKNKSVIDIKQCLERIIIFLNLISIELKLSLPSCYEEAYNVIKDRKGKTTAEGNFIKEGD